MECPIDRLEQRDVLYRVIVHIPQSFLYSACRSGIQHTFRDPNRAKIYSWIKNTKGTPMLVSLSKKKLPKLEEFFFSKPELWNVC